MDVNALPLDAEEMLGGLRRFVECESPTFDAAAVNRVMTLAAAPLAGLGAAVERLDGPAGFGDCVRARLPHRKAGEPGILVMAHLDTVHPVGTLARMPFRREGARCFGPGIFDMKGGFYVALEAARQLHRAVIATKLPVTFLLTCDEEIGSPGTRDLILAEARRGGRNMCWCPSLPAAMAASSTAATPLRATISRPSAGQAMRARH
jgi:glutamate carboxypeptidase